MRERDYIRSAVLIVLQQSGKAMSRDAIFARISQKFPKVTEEQVWGVMVELSFEGLAKVDYEPTVAITEAGRGVSA